MRYSDALRDDTDLDLYAGYQLGYHYGTYEVGGEESKVRNLHNLITLGAAITF